MLQSPPGVHLPFPWEGLLASKGYRLVPWDCRNKIPHTGQLKTMEIYSQIWKPGVPDPGVGRFLLPGRAPEEKPSPHLSGSWRLPAILAVPCHVDASLQSCLVFQWPPSLRIPVASSPFLGRTPVLAPKPTLTQGGLVLM